MLAETGRDDMIVVLERVDTPEDALRLGFVGSPPILPDGSIPSRQTLPVATDCRVASTARRRERLVLRRRSTWANSECLAHQVQSITPPSVMPCLVIRVVSPSMPTMVPSASSAIPTQA